MRTLLIFLLVCCCSISNGQGFSYPAINQKGLQLNDFIPPGWMILDSAIGDLNKDGLKDAAIVLQHKDSVTIVKPENDTVITQPRVLVILFNSPGKGYYLQEQSQTFILNHDDPAMEEPFAGLSIDKGILQIEFEIFYNMGSWYSAYATYKFRYQNNQFVLIGADKSSYNRSASNYEAYTYNFLTKKVSLTKEDDEKSTKKTIWKSLKLPVLKTLKTFKEPFSWEIEKDIFL